MLTLPYLANQLLGRGQAAGLPIGQYFLYKLIGQQKDVGYKKLLTTELVTQVTPVQ